jgi:hypothetical protein
MDKDFAQKHQIPLHQLPCPVSVVVIDGRPIALRKIVEESEPVHILLGDLGCVVSFNIIYIAQSIQLSLACHGLNCTTQELIGEKKRFNALQKEGSLSMIEPKTLSLKSIVLPIQLLSTK